MVGRKIIEPKGTLGASVPSMALLAEEQLWREWEVIARIMMIRV